VSVEDLLVINWRGVQLHRVADLEEWRRSRYELLDEYEPALSACKWSTAEDAVVARVHYECGRWTAVWSVYGSQLHATLEEALAECDTLCLKRAEEHIAAALKLMQGVNLSTDVKRSA